MAQADVSRTGDADLNQGKPQGRVPPEKWADPVPSSPVSREFRQFLHERESTKGNYQAENGDAWGRYQPTETARQEAGLQDKAGNFTGKYGVRSKEDFLNSPEAQERAFADYMNSNERQLRAKGAMGRTGQEIEGIKGRFTVIESGLAAAAHRHGAGGVNQYLNHLRAHDWKSDPATFPDRETEAMFRAIETRLREAQNIPYRKEGATK